MSVTHAFQPSKRFAARLARCAAIICLAFAPVLVIASLVFEYQNKPNAHHYLWVGVGSFVAALRLARGADPSEQIPLLPKSSLEFWQQMARRQTVCDNRRMHEGERQAANFQELEAATKRLLESLPLNKDERALADRMSAEVFVHCDALRRKQKEKTGSEASLMVGAAAIALALLSAEHRLRIHKRDE